MTTAKENIKYKDAQTGRYITKKYADDHPETTVTEKDKPKKKKRY